MNTETKSFTPKEIKDLWSTPQFIFDYLNREFNFTTDVCANDTNHKCDHYITEEMDGLTSDWGDVNWCNPPYSDIPPWVEKATFEAEFEGRTTVMIVPSDTSVQWFSDAFNSCDEVRFIKGRVSFIRSDINLPVNGNNKGSVLLIWRGDRNRKLVDLVNRDDMKGCGDE